MCHAVVCVCCYVLPRHVAMIWTFIFMLVEQKAINIVPEFQNKSLNIFVTYK